MTSASNQMITRCPKCGTAFRVTQSQLQSAKGAVRCGSCLNVFKAQEYLVAVKPKTPPAATGTAVIPAPDATQDRRVSDTPVAPQSTKAQLHKPTPTSDTAAPAQPQAAQVARTLELKKPDFSAQKNLSPGEEKPANPVRSIKPITLDDSDDVLISDDMEEPSSSENKYEFDSFMDIDIKPTTDVSLFERKMRPENDDNAIKDADESWAEMLIEDEEEDLPKLGIARPKTDEELADEALIASHQAAPRSQPDNTETATSQPATPGLVFSLIGESENQQTPPADEFIFSDELAQIPSHQGFKPTSEPRAQSDEATADPEPEEPFAASEDNHKRQVKTQPKIRAYDGSRAALLMNIIPAPIEFTAKSMRRWYQRKLWATLSLLGLITLAAQIAWFKFDSLSRIEPYRTAYLFACPYLGCEIPTLVDTRLITTSNLVVREHPDAKNALAVDVMLVNSAAFEQPFPDLMLIFSDLDNNLVASRRFTPKDYLGGELAGTDLMPKNQKVYITLDIVDPGAEAVNYRIYIP